jgi:hypothetical protein
MPSTPEFTFSDLGLAFELGIPIADPAIEFEPNPTHQGFKDASAHHQGSRVRRKHPSFIPERSSPHHPAPGNQVANVTFQLNHLPVSPADYDAVQSRLHNVHFDRPSSLALLKCHFRAVGCLIPASTGTPPGSSSGSSSLGGPTSVGLNVMKTSSADPAEYCGESRALRRLVLGVNQRLLSVASLYEATWMGPSPLRLHRLLAARSTDPVAPSYDHEPPGLGRTSTEAAVERASFAHGPQNPSRSNRSSSLASPAHGGPVWEVAVHVRVGFSFVERGSDEASHESEIEAWLATPGTQKALAEVVAQVRTHLATSQPQRQRTGAREEAGGGGGGGGGEGEEGEGEGGEESLHGVRQPFAVYVASETSTVRAAVAALIEAGCPGAQVDYFNFSGVFAFSSWALEPPAPPPTKSL